MARQGLDRGVLDDAAGERREMGVHASEELPRARLRGHRADLDIGVRQQQPEDLTSGVPARARDRSPDHVHDYTCPRESIH